MSCVDSPMRLLIGVACVVGCARLPPVAPPPAATTVHAAKATLAVPGELMEMAVAWRGITVGYVQIAVGEPGVVHGRRAIIVRSRGTTDGVLAMLGELTWELTTTVDLDDGFPIESIEESSARLLDGKPAHAWHHHGGAHRHDVHSLVGVLRGSAPELAQRLELEADIGGALIPIVIWHDGHEFLAGQKAPSSRYAGTAFGKFPFTLWLSDDAQRVPQRLHAASRWGSIDIELVDYR